MNFETKCDILGQFWFEFRDDEKLKDFIEYNDIGLPLAWFISTGVVTSTPMAEDYVDETFDLFISALEVSENEVDQFTNLNDLLAYIEDRS
jgi:hypothetical protein